ncbi:MAG: hypothetical protein HGA96_17155 [Desulfobulbaceae bacterium]|nr:hypothetical protein [Desulfobulbaceae bacterium]
MLLLSQSPALFTAWLLWCCGHSLTASRRVKSWLGILCNLSPRGYRFGYVLVSALTLAPLLVWQLRVVSLPAPAALPWQAFRFSLFAYAAYMFYAGGHSYDLKEFLGLATGASGDAAPQPFRRAGILARVRHPWYSGGCALMLGLGGTPGDRWDWRLLVVAYLVFGCLVEERRLRAEVGAVYQEYQREVPMLLPRLGKIG